MPTMEFGEWIKDARGRKGWSQSILARRADLTEKAINRLETGKSVPRYPTLLKIIAALDEVPPVLASYGATLELFGVHSPVNSHDPKKIDKLSDLAPGRESDVRSAA